MSLQYEKRLVGFIDILGFKQHTEHAQKNNDIKTFQSKIVLIVSTNYLKNITTNNKSKMLELPHFLIVSSSQYL